MKWKNGDLVQDPGRDVGIIVVPNVDRPGPRVQRCVVYMFESEGWSTLCEDVLTRMVPSFAGPVPCGARGAPRDGGVMAQSFESGDLVEVRGWTGRRHAIVLCVNSELLKNYKVQRIGLKSPKRGRHVVHESYLCRAVASFLGPVRITE